MHPGAALRIAYEAEEGFSAALSLASLPQSQIDVAAQASLASDSSFIDATLRPRVRAHRVGTAELAYRGSRAGVWASSSWEHPLDAAPLAGDWMTDAQNPAWIGAVGAHWQAIRALELAASQIWINESSSVSAASTTPSMSLDLPSRFSFTHAFRLGANLRFGPRWGGEFQWVRDFASRGHQLSASLGYGNLASGVEHWRAQVGTDFFWGDFTDTGVGRYVGNDRIRGSLTYAF
jgi:hypothetical protein